MVMPEMVSYQSLQKVFLRILAIMYFCRGVQLYIEPEKIIPDWALPHEFIPNDINAGVWFGSAAIVFLLSYSSRVEWAFAIAMIMPVMRAISYWWSFIVFLAPNGHPGRPSSIAWAGWWTGFAFLVFYVGSWAGMQVNKLPRKDSQHGRE